MASKKLADELDDCLEGLQEHGEDLLTCLGKHPQFAQELRPLLELAVALRVARIGKQPSPRFVLGLKDKLTKPKAGGNALKGGGRP